MRYLLIIMLLAFSGSAFAKAKVVYKQKHDLVLSSAQFDAALADCTKIVERHLNQAGGGQFDANVYQLIATCLTNKGHNTPLQK